LIEYGDTLDLRPFSNNQAIAIAGNEVDIQTSAKPR
jgi:dipeptidase E